MLSEKLITIANNTEKVFNAGYNKGLKENPPGGATEEELNAKYQEGYDTGFSIGWQDGSSSSRDVWYQNGLMEGREEGIEEGLGKAILTQEEFLADKPQTHYDAFWNAYQENGNRTDYRYGFAGTGWTEETYNPKYPIVTAAFTATSMYQNALVTKVKNVDFSNVLNYFTSIFNNCTKLKTIENIKLPTNCQGAFTASFNNCTALEEFSFTGTIQNNGIDLHWSTLLNKTSIESIINALSTTTTGLTVTLSQTAVSNAFTDTEWEALEATKTNWTISLV